MAVRLAGANARDHACGEHRLALVGHQRHFAFEDIDELVLALVPVALRRPGGGRQLEQVDAELREPEGVAQSAAAALPAGHVVRRWIVRADAHLDVVGVQGGPGGRHGHSTAHFGGRFSAKARNPSAASGLRRASANMSAAKSSTVASGSVPAFWTIALLAALANGAQRSASVTLPPTFPSRPTKTFTRTFT